jgi:hypothetical protein
MDVPHVAVHHRQHGGGYRNTGSESALPLDFSLFYNSDFQTWSEPNIVQAGALWKFGLAV